MKRNHYNTDVSDSEWLVIKKLLPAPKTTGRPRLYPLREVIDAIFYVTRAGCQWRLLPHDFPPWSTVYGYFRLWKIFGIWAQINADLLTAIRISVGRNRQPSAAIIDSQSAKTTEVGGERGYDAGKKVNGRKRHILVDVQGLVLDAIVHPADIQDRDGAKLLMEKISGRFPDLKLIWADGGYAGKLIEWVKQKLGVVLEIVRRSSDTSGFKVLPRRWVVERTFGWIGRNRRMSKDYERTTTSEESFIYTSMIRLMVRRLGEASP